MMETDKEIQKQLKSLELLRNKLSQDLDKEKYDMVDFFKKIKKDDLFPKPKKLTLWQRIKKVLNF